MGSPVYSDNSPSLENKTAIAKPKPANNQAAKAKSDGVIGKSKSTPPATARKIEPIVGLTDADHWEPVVSPFSSWWIKIKSFFTNN